MKSIETTHIGSLPFTDREKALDYTFSFDVPVLFSLPKLDEDELMGKDLVLGLGIGGVDKDFKLSLSKNYLTNKKQFWPTHADEFLKRLEKNKSKRFKYQLIGPYTFYTLLKEKVSKDDLFDFLEKKYSQVLSSLAMYGECLFSLDEPFLYKANAVDLKKLCALQKNLSLKHNLDIYLHVCSKLSFEGLRHLDKGSLNLDCSLYSESELLSLYDLNFIGLNLFEDNTKKVLSLKKITSSKQLISHSCGLANNKQCDSMLVLKKLEAIRKMLLAED